MRSKTQLLLRIRCADGRFRYQRPWCNGNGKPKPHYAMVAGEPEHHSEGVYYVRDTEKGKQQRINVGSDASLALTRQLQKEHALKGAALGMETVPSLTKGKTASEDSPRTLWAPVERTYMLEIEDRKSRRTATAYRAALEQFNALCPVTYVEEVDRARLLLFEYKLRAKGNSPRTVYNRLRQLGTFLRYAGCGTVLKRNDMPTYTQKAAVAYGREEIDRLFAEATPQDLLLFEFFLYTGCREQEVMYSARTDIDFEHGLLYVHEKRDLGWQPKDREERSIPIPDVLIDKLKIHCAAHPKQRWLFPGSRGNPDGHFLRRLKMLALAAGVNCGCCKTKKGLCCDKHPVCMRH